MPSAKVSAWSRVMGAPSCWLAIMLATRQLVRRRLYLGVQVLDGVGHPGDQPAAANGDHHGIGAFQLVQNFQADGPLAGDDLIVIKGVDKGSPSLLLELEGGGVGVVVGPFTRRTSAPNCLVASTLLMGAPSGMQIRDLIPLWVAAMATPWAWFPACRPGCRAASPPRRAG